MYVRHPREQYDTIVSLPKEQWEGVDFYGLMYALGTSLSEEKAEEVRSEFIRRFFPWRHIAVLMAEDILYGEIPDIKNPKHVIKFYRKELEDLYPEIFLYAVKRIEQSRSYYEVLPKSKEKCDYQTLDYSNEQNR